MISLKRALKIAKEKEGYERCFNKAHGLGKMITVNGKTKKAKFCMCPIVQFYPKPSILFHSVKDFLISSEIFYKEKGWIK